MDIWEWLFLIGLLLFLSVGVLGLCCLLEPRNKRSKIKTISEEERLTDIKRWEEQE